MTIQCASTTNKNGINILTILLYILINDHSSVINYYDMAAVEEELILRKKHIIDSTQQYKWVPKSIVSKICENLNYDSAIALLQTNKFFYKLKYDPVMVWNSNIPIDNLPKLIGSSSIKPGIKKLLLNFSYNSYEDGKFILDSFNFKPLEYINVFSLDYKMSQEFFDFIISKMSTLRSLYMKVGHVPSIDTLTRIYAPHLTNLSLDLASCKIAKMMVWNEMPLLKVLYVSIDHLDVDSFTKAKIQLEKLRLDSKITEYGTNIKIVKFLTDIDKSRLKSLSIVTPLGPQFSNELFIPINECSNLKELNLMMKIDAKKIKIPTSIEHLNIPSKLLQELPIGELKNLTNLNVSRNIYLDLFELRNAIKSLRASRIRFGKLEYTNLQVLNFHFVLTNSNSLTNIMIKCLNLKFLNVRISERCESDYKHVSAPYNMKYLTKIYITARSRNTKIDSAVTDFFTAGSFPKLDELGLIHINPDITLTSNLKSLSICHVPIPRHDLVNWSSLKDLIYNESDEKFITHLATMCTKLITCRIRQMTFDQLYEFVSTCTSLRRIRFNPSDDFDMEKFEKFKIDIKSRRDLIINFI